MKNNKFEFEMVIDVVIKNKSRQWKAGNSIEFHVSDLGGLATRQGVKVGSWTVDRFGMASEAETSLTLEEIQAIRKEVEGE